MHYNFPFLHQSIIRNKEIQVQHCYLSMRSTAALPELNLETEGACEVYLKQESRFQAASAQELGTQSKIGHMTTAGALFVILLFCLSVGTLVGGLLAQRAPLLLRKTLSSVKFTYKSDGNDGVLLLGFES